MQGLRLTSVLLLGLIMVGCTDKSNDLEMGLRPEIDRPNILVIVADDLGYTDLGSFGGDVDTPNLDRLAYRGTRLTNFHAGATCAPSRAMLLTGRYNHLAGVGSQRGLESPEQKGTPAYRNQLLQGIPTIASLLRDEGYQTFASTKWHVGYDPDALPGARGFDRSFALLQGASMHFGGGPFMENYPAMWVEDDKPTTLPDDFYSTDYFTSKLLEYMDDSDPERPFFALLGVTAPHWPLQAPEHLIEKYADRYVDGWDALRSARIKGAVNAGVIADGSLSVDFEPGMQTWSDISEEEKARAARSMAVYSAMIEHLDINVGRILAHLEAKGELDNTIILFLSDNGSDPVAVEKFANQNGWVDRNFSSDIDDMGGPNSYLSLGVGWTRAVTAPWRDSKMNLSEGGVRVPAFISFPGSKPKATDDSYMHVIDILPTVLELAGGTKPDSISGRSQLARLTGGDPAYGPDDRLTFELFGRRAVIQGKWKALNQAEPYGTGEWTLYDLKADPREQIDLAEQHPQLLASLIAEWERYAEEAGVILPSSTLR